MDELNELERVNSLIAFLSNLQQLSRDTYQLKMKYALENEANGHVPNWKRSVADKRMHFEKASPMSPEKRNAPDIGPEEAERMWALLPEGHFTLLNAKRIFGLESKEMRRQFFWMLRRRLMKQYPVTQTFKKRNEAEKGKRLSTTTFTTDGIKQKRRTPKYEMWD